MGLSFVLLDELLKHYSVKEEDVSKLYKYLAIRCGLALDSKKWTSNDFLKFVLSELNIQTFGDYSEQIIYNEEKYSLISVGSDFLDNFEFRASLEGNLDYKDLMNNIYAKGYKKSNKYRELNEYKSIIKLNRLQELNNELEITPSSSMGVEGFKTDEHHNPFKRTLEEILEAKIQAEKFIGTNNTTYITEKTFEDYVVSNLSLLEEDLVCIGRQIEVDGGIIDLLARDKNGTLTIIELKIDEDRTIVWQSIHYPEEIKRIYGVDHVRMLTLAPSYSGALLKTLKSLKNVEIYDYEIDVTAGEIKSLKIKPL